MRNHFSGIVVTILLALLAAGIGATYWLHVIAAPSSVASHRSLSRGRVASTDKKGEPGSPEGQVDVVRFASNAVLAPPFLVSDLDGQLISTADWHGKVVLLNFWATWCPPCREEIPELTELADRYKDHLEIVGVAMDDSSPAEVREFVRRFGIRYPVIMASREIVSEYGGVPALPTSFVIGPDGRVVQKHVGLYPLEVYETEIRALLGLSIEAKVEHFEDKGQIFLKNASLATELPGVDFRGLTESGRREALKRMNSENCTCGCGMTIAQCRILDSSCPISQQIGAQIVKDTLAGRRTPPEQSTSK
ncbi:MAG TPA: TlpA disulfide reductase family protein [Candidatus Cybelea sp.]|nr:TlpA disulfide reductase family protein [Candidatus Cybelea sp.]